MSAKLAMKIWESGLPDHLKPVASVYALFGNDAGEKIFPSVGRVAWLVGKNERWVRAVASVLRDMGVLVPTSAGAGGRGADGRGLPTRYVLNADALPSREPWRPKPGSPHQGSAAKNPDPHVRVLNEPDSENPVLQDQEPCPPGPRTLISRTENPDLQDSQSFSDLSLTSVGGRQEPSKPISVPASSASVGAGSAAAPATRGSAALTLHSQTMNPDEPPPVTAAPSPAAKNTPRTRQLATELEAGERPTPRPGPSPLLGSDTDTPPPKEPDTMNNLSDLIAQTKARIGFTAPQPDAPTEDPVITAATALLAERPDITTSAQLQVAVLELGHPPDSNTESAIKTAWARHALRITAATPLAAKNSRRTRRRAAAGEA